MGHRTGLWIYHFDSNEPVKVFDSQNMAASWAPNKKTKLALHLGPPYFEIWSADLDPNIPTIESLSPVRTLNEHYEEMIAIYTRRIEADPMNAYAYSDRARYYDCLHDREKVDADMRCWSSILSSKSVSHYPLASSQKTRRYINGPFGYQLIFSIERFENGIQVPCIALGQKGRCNMKSFQIPMLSMSLFGLCLLSGLDTPPAYPDFTFGEPVNLKEVIPVIDPIDELINCFSSDGLEIYLDSIRSEGYGKSDVWRLRRDSINADWGPPENLGPLINTPSIDNSSSISTDGLTLYFLSNRPDGYGKADIYMTTRATRNDPWEQAVNLGPVVNSSSSDYFPCISPDNLELYFSSNRPGGYGRRDIYVTRRATADAPWGEPVNLGPEVNSPYAEVCGSLSPDGLLLIFGEEFARKGSRPGGYGGGDLWMTRRASLSDPWQASMNLGPKVNSSIIELAPCISPEGSMLYFATVSYEGIWENWQVPIEPVVDFNSDGIVDAADMCIMIEHWLTDYELCDIGPMPWGDGIVDVQDLIVLAEHLFEEFPPVEPGE
jgi:hypothetical protein